jgi:UDP-N-acetylmuramate--alanine ligase
MSIHFIGIGGIGVSALARYYLAKGFLISGSDLSESEITETLGKKGVKIMIGPHKADNLPEDTDLVVYTAATENKNPELAEAHKLKIKCQTYAQALGDLTKKYFTIAVSGTHGKSTTTSMIAQILVKAGFDPTVIVGTKLREFGNSNFRLGKSRYLVIEADEYNASFLNYWPKIIVLTNIEEDHLDYYRDIDHILATFKKYIGHLDKEGILIANTNDENIRKIIKNSKFKIQNYVLDCKPDGINLMIPGRHNLLNAYAALTVARVLKIRDLTSTKSLNGFKGTWRRFEYKGMVRGAKIFDDYGHHPTEIKATLKGARELLTIGSGSKKMSRLWCIFQPHQFERTYKLYGQFVGAFDEADKIILLPIFSVAGRETAGIKKKVNSKKMAAAIKKRNHRLRYEGKSVLFLDSFKKSVTYLKKNLKKGDIAVIMGAGDIYKLTGQLF